MSAQFQDLKSQLTPRSFGCYYIAAGFAHKGFSYWRFMRNLAVPGVRFLLANDVEGLLNPFLIENDNRTAYLDRAGGCPSVDDRCLLQNELKLLNASL